MRRSSFAAAALVIGGYAVAQSPPVMPAQDVNQFYEFSPDSLAKVGVPRGTINGPFKLPSKAYPGTLHDYWIYVPAQYENFIKDQPVRRLEQKDIQNVQGIWTARTLEMTDLRRKSRTILRLEKLEYNVPVKEDEFTVQALRREQ